MAATPLIWEGAEITKRSAGARELQFLVAKKNKAWDFCAQMIDNRDDFEEFMGTLSEHHELVESLTIVANMKFFTYNPIRIFRVLAICDLLKVLKIEDCALGDTDAEFISEFIRDSPSIVALSLGANQLGPASAKMIFGALAYNEQILDFRCAYNKRMGNASMEYVSNMLSSNNVMETLDINETGFNAEGENVLIRGLDLNNRIRTLTYKHFTKSEKVIDRVKKNNLLWRENFLKDLDKEQTGKWNRSKLMFIGQGRAGKTSTVNRLLHKGFDQKQDSTVGASVSQTQTSTTNQQKWKQVNENDPEFLGKGMVAGNAGKVIAAKKILNHDPSKKKNKNAKKKNNRLAAEKNRNKRRRKKNEGDKALEMAIGDAWIEQQDRENREHAADELFAQQEAQRQDMNEFGFHDEMDEERMREMLLNREELEKRRKEEEQDAEAAKMYAEAVFKAARESKDSITFSLWDYGGQTVFYALHHLFLTKYGIYVLCCDMREILHNEKVALNYLLFWLNSVKLHAPTAPVLLVGTYLDALETKEEVMAVEEFVVQNFSKKFKQLTSLHPQYHFYPIDNKNNKGVDNLRFDIERISRKQEFVTAEVSLRWLYCLDKMLLEKTDQGDTPLWLSLSRVREVSKKVNLTSHDELEKMLGLFHELGVIVRLTNTEQLRNVITLDPQWLIDALCQVIRDDRLHNNFDKEQLEQAGLVDDVDLLYKKALATQDVMTFLWKGDKWKDHHHFLLDLMKYMVLISDWDFRNEKMYIVPSLLTPRLEEVDLFANPHETKESEKDGKVIDLTAVMEKKQEKKGKKSKKSKKVEEQVEKEEEKEEPEERTENSVNDYMVFDFSKLFLPVGVFQRLVCLCVSYSTTVGSNGNRTTEPELYQVWAKIWMGNDLIIFLEQRGDEIWMSVDDPITAPTCFKAINSMLGKLNNDLMGSGLQWDISVKRVRRVVTQRKGEKPVINEAVELDLPLKKAEKKAVKPWFVKENTDAPPADDILNLNKFVDSF